MTAQLIDVESGFHLFSHAYDCQLRDIFELQDELAAAVAEEIAPAAQPSRKVSRTTNLDAYNAYLRGLFAMSNEFVDLDTYIGVLPPGAKSRPSITPPRGPVCPTATSCWPGFTVRRSKS